MLSGDNEATARRIASQLGIDTIIADVLPEDKVLPGAVDEDFGVIGVDDESLMRTAPLGCGERGRGGLGDGIVIAVTRWSAR